jgi:hypothetical protein
VTASDLVVRADTVRSPDRDYETLRQRAMALLAALAPGWTDHNASDPGVTVAEVVAWGLADLHYRTETFPLDGWSAEVGLWRAAADRHWSGVPLPAAPAQFLALAAALRALPAATVAAVRAAVEPGEAARAVANAAGLDPALAAAAVRLLREPLVLEAALDGGAAVDAAATEPTEPAALALLRLEPAFAGLWEDELRALLRRRRHRLLARTIRDRAGELRAAIAAASGPAAAEAAVTALTGFGPAEARDALTVHPHPPATPPEHWEQPVGRTTTWPPHPLQARTVEPVTAADYARLARSAPGVRRAWVVPEVLPGVGWDSGAVNARAARPGAVTLLVEATDTTLPAAPVATQRTFLRAVLRAAIGPEVDHPYAELQLDLTGPAPRRTICDEVGAALLSRCGVTLRGILHVPVTADRTAVLAAAMARVVAFFAAGRAETAVSSPEPVLPRDMDGPWPLEAAAQPGGWRPGDPVRIPELVQVLSADPDVYGVEALEARRPGGAWHAVELPLDPDCVPELATQQCVEVKLDLVEECSDGC